MLTGESIPAEAERDKVAYAGGIVRRGEATAAIIATGARTYFGRAAELVRTAHVESSELRDTCALPRWTEKSQCHKRLKLHPFLKIAFSPPYLLKNSSASCRSSSLFR